MLVPLLLLLAQQAGPNPIDRIDIRPAQATIPVGGSVQLSATALDASGRPVPGAIIRWFGVGDGGEVDSTGTVRGNYIGLLRVTASASVGPGRPTIGQALVTITPQPATRIVLDGAPARLVVGSRLSLSGDAYSAQDDRRDDRLAFSSSNERVMTVTRDGRATAIAAGVATITAAAGAATASQQFTVVATQPARVTVLPGDSTVRTGDVVRFRARASDAAGSSISDVGVRWSLAALDDGAVAQIDDAGDFVAETPGRYTVTATIGTHSADALIHAVPRGVGRGFEVLGRAPLPFRGAEVWVHPSGTCAYMTTLADRLYAIDVSDVRAPRIVDSIVTNARLLNDVMTTEDGRTGVFSREGASDRKNGIVIFDASSPCHPRPVADYTETVSGGVHSSFVYQNHVYLTDDATGSLRVIDISTPSAPKEVGRWQAEQTEEGRYVHDVDVQDGLAYLSYWNDGLIILDVGNGIKGGSPTSPRLVSQLKYNLTDLYRKIEERYGLGPRGTHTAWRHKEYVFIGDEVYASRSETGLAGGNGHTFGQLQVVDVSDIEHPRIVAWYAPEDAGVHNIWVAGDTLYMGAYQGGARTLDVSGKLKGDLLRQGREMSWLATADSMGAVPRVPYAWGAVVHNGIMFVPDINSGLWILKMEAKPGRLTP